MQAKIPFVGPSFAYPDLPLGVQSSLNYYLELVSEGQTRSSMALRGCPGLVPEVTSLDGKIRGILEANDATYVVAGSQFYSVDSNFNETSLGSVAGTDNFYFVEGTNYILLCDKPIAYLKGYALIPNSVFLAYTYNKNTGIFGAITDADFNSTSNKSQFFISALEDFTSYDPLEFDSANVQPDDLLGIVALGTQAIMVGRRSFEFWYYSGAVEFPFAQQDGATLKKGCKAYRSIADGNNTIFWLGDDLSVYMLNGFTDYRISNSVIEDIISRETNIDQTQGFYHYWQGHKFYTLILPSGKSLVFDALLASNPDIAWHERESWNKGRWRASCAGYGNNKVLVGDYDKGSIYSLSATTYTDDGGILEATRIGNYIHADNRSFSLPEFQITFNNGQGLTASPDADPLVSLSISRDGGRTFSKGRTKSLGKDGEYLKKIKWRNNGRSRTSMAIKTTITADCPRDIIDATGIFNAGI